MWIILFVGFLFGDMMAAVSLEPARNRMVKQLIHDIHRRHQIPTDWLNQQFAGLTLNETSLNLMQRPFEAKPWHQYRFNNWFKKNM